MTKENVPVLETETQQKLWLNEAIAEEICRLINNGFSDPDEIIKNFNLQYDLSKHGKLLLNLEHDGFRGLPDEINQNIINIKWL